MANHIPRSAAAEDMASDNTAAFARWEQSYREAFRHDGGRRFRADLERFGLEGTSEEMLDATVDLVCACVAIRLVDGREVAELLDRQTYDKTSSPDPVVPY